MPLIKLQKIALVSSDRIILLLSASTCIFVELASDTTPAKQSDFVSWLCTEASVSAAQEVTCIFWVF